MSLPIVVVVLFACIIVRSWSPHGSAGLQVGAGYSDFLNQDLALRLQPAVEYNVFPWTQTTREPPYSIGMPRADSVSRQRPRTCHGTRIVLRTGVLMRGPWRAAAVEGHSPRGGSVRLVARNGCAKPDSHFPRANAQEARLTPELRIVPRIVPRIGHRERRRGSRL